MSFLNEAALMAEYCEERPGNTLAGLEFLDLNPQYRLALEGLVESPNGNLFEEQDNYTGGDSLPVHLRKERRFYLNKTRDFTGVQRLLEAMSRLYAVPGFTVTACLKEARRWFLERCETLGSPSAGLEAMTEYFLVLLDDLPELEPGDGMTNLNDREIGVANIGRDDNYELVARGYTMYVNTDIPQGDEEFIACGSTTRQVLAHTPNGDLEKDWVQRQSVKWQNLFFDMRKCAKLKDLPVFNEVIREKVESKVYMGAQVRVLWDMYFIKREYLRKQAKRLALLNMSECATKLIASIERQVDCVHMGRMVGPCLYAWSHGEEFMNKSLPGVMTKAEWSVVWDVYKGKKEVLNAVS